MMPMKLKNSVCEAPCHKKVAAYTQRGARITYIHTHLLCEPCCDLGWQT